MPDQTVREYLARLAQEQQLEQQRLEESLSRRHAAASRADSSSAPGEDLQSPRRLPVQRAATSASLALHGTPKPRRAPSGSSDSSRRRSLGPAGTPSGRRSGASDAGAAAAGAAGSSDVRADSSRSGSDEDSLFGGSKRKLDCVIKAGFMFKLSDVIKRWNQRYFVLKPGFLFYFASDTDEYRKPKGVVPLYGCSVEEAGSGDGGFGFVVYHESNAETELTLRCDTRAEMEHWMQWFTMAAAGQTGAVDQEDVRAQRTVHKQIKEQLTQEVATLRAELDTLRADYTQSEAQHTASRDANRTLAKEVRRLNALLDSQRDHSAALLKDLKRQKQQAKAKLEAASESGSRLERDVEQLCTMSASLHEMLRNARVEYLRENARRGADASTSEHETKLVRSSTHIVSRMRSEIEQLARPADETELPLVQQLRAAQSVVLSDLAHLTLRANDARLRELRVQTALDQLGSEPASSALVEAFWDLDSTTAASATIASPQSSRFSALMSPSSSSSSSSGVGRPTPGAPLDAVGVASPVLVAESVSVSPVGMSSRTGGAGMGLHARVTPR